ncbi:MAG: HIT domain-containing protein [Nanoarchaeota archaeon]
MAFTKVQAEEIKKQLFLEIKKMPNADHEQIEQYIASLDEKQLEEFLKTNNIQLADSMQDNSPSEKEPFIFQAIVENKLNSYKIAENEMAIAILEINPLAPAHTLVIPKEKYDIEKIPKKAFSLAQKIAKKIKIKLKPLEVKIETFQLQGYAALNVIPLYKNKPLKKEKEKEENLQKMQMLLEIKKEEKIIKKRASSKEKEIKPRAPKFY